MTLDEIEVFLTERSEAIRGLVPLAQMSPTVYWSQGHFKVLQAEAVEAHFFELALILRRMGVNRVEWTLLDRAERRDRGQRLDVVFSYFRDETRKGGSEISYYLTRQDGCWQVELVEVRESAIWIEAHRRVEARMAAAH